MCYAVVPLGFIWIVIMLTMSWPMQARGGGATKNDWSSNYGFSSATSKSVALTQADLIKKGESDYYDELGKSTTNIGVMNTYDQQGIFNNVENQMGEMNLSDAYTESTSIGSQNNSSTDIANSGTGTIDVTNASDSAGDLDSSVSLEKWSE